MVRDSLSSDRQRRNLVPERRFSISLLGGWHPPSFRFRHSSRAAVMQCRNCVGVSFIGREEDEGGACVRAYAGRKEGIGRSMKEWRRREARLGRCSGW